MAQPAGVDGCYRKSVPIQWTTYHSSQSGQVRFLFRLLLQLQLHVCHWTDLNSKLTSKQTHKQTYIRRGRQAYRRPSVYLEVKHKGRQTYRQTFTNRHTVFLVLLAYRRHTDIHRDSLFSVLLAYRGHKDIYTYIHTYTQTQSVFQFCLNEDV